MTGAPRSGSLDVAVPEAAGATGASSAPRIAYDFAVLRVVPNVATGACVNVGVILHARTAEFLGLRVIRDPAALRALCAPGTVAPGTVAPGTVATRSGIPRTGIPHTGVQHTNVPGIDTSHFGIPRTGAPATTRAPVFDIDLLARYLAACEAICRGDVDAGPVALTSPSERFHWLTAPRSDVLQASPVHEGVCEDPARALEELFASYVQG